MINVKVLLIENGELGSIVENLNFPEAHEWLENLTHVRQVSR